MPRNVLWRVAAIAVLIELAVSVVRTRTESSSRPTLDLQLSSSSSSVLDRIEEQGIDHFSTEPSNLAVELNRKLERESKLAEMPNEGLTVDAGSTDYFRCPKPDVARTIPNRVADYDLVECLGFKVRLSRRLNGKAEIQANLAFRLQEVLDCIPAGFDDLFRAVPIWIEEGDASELRSRGLRQSDAAYVSSRAVDFDRWEILPEKVGGIEIFAERTLRNMEFAERLRLRGNWLLHEFAHAMHDRVLGEYHPDVIETFRQARDRKLYENVPYREWDWESQSWHSTRRRAYARINYFEYFAELSVAYFSQSHECFPHTRDNLRHYDPAGFRLMESFWQTKQFTLINEYGTPIEVAWVGGNGERHRVAELMPKQPHTFVGWSRLSLVGKVGAEFGIRPPADGEEVWRISAANCFSLPATPTGESR